MTSKDTFLMFGMENLFQSKIQNYPLYILGGPGVTVKLDGLPDGDDLDPRLGHRYHDGLRGAGRHWKYKIFFQ